MQLANVSKVGGGLADRMANSEDNNQTVPMRASCLIWACSVCPDLSVQKLRHNTLSGKMEVYLSKLINASSITKAGHLVVVRSGHYYWIMKAN